ncbi:MAG: DNA repair protein, partial [Eggerthellaceae bacterium]|nr:DNA repair protein [Eggerthellaceae bacterium]
DLAGVAAMEPATLYREFGKNAEYLIDHAWGQEPCTIAEIQSYVPEGRSLVNGQVLPCDYSFDEARLVMREMAEASVLELVEQGLATNHISLHVGYKRNEGANAGEGKRELFDGGHGLRPAHGGRMGVYSGGSRKLDRYTNSRSYLIARLEELFDETTSRSTPIRRVNIGFAGLSPESAITPTLFDDIEAYERENDLQKTVAAVREKFGKNALLKASSLKEKATARERNEQVGGHHA